MRPETRRGWIGGLAFVLPLLVAILTDVVAGSASSNGSDVVPLFDLFVASVVVATGVTGIVIMAASGSLVRRLVLAAVVWIMLLLEVAGSLLWLLRGLD
jgi:hypothetical protein